MKPLRVALVHRKSTRTLEKRMVGWWAYEVPEFEVNHFPVRPPWFTLKRSQFVGEYDLIFYEDGKAQGQIVNDADIPVVYHVVDSTLSEEHYDLRVSQAKLNADLVVVDWDRLERFEHLGLPVRRFGYCVNDKLFYDRGLPRIYDVGFFVGKTKERGKLGRWLKEFCGANGLSFGAGIRAGEDYAKAMAQSKIVVNLNRNAETRSHRVFDAMACRSCVITSPLPEVSGEVRLAGVNYLEYQSLDMLGRLIKHLVGKQLANQPVGEAQYWQDYAGDGYELVREFHTWRVRAGELRRVLAETFEGLA